MKRSRLKRDPSFEDVLSWIQSVEEDHHVFITVVYAMRPPVGTAKRKASIVVAAQARNGVGTGAERVARTGSFPTAGAVGPNSVVLNLLHQVDNALAWQEADALSQQEIAPLP